jgi:hypothetical protein
MPAQINISIIVDVVGALRAGTLSGFVNMRDNSRLPCTTGQGTDVLSTACPGGTVLNWFVYPVDVQAPAALQALTFLGPGEPLEKLRIYGYPVSQPDHVTTPIAYPYWAGLVRPDLVPGVYYYQVELQLATRSMLLPRLPSVQVLPGVTGRRTLTGRTMQQTAALYAAGNV